MVTTGEPNASHWARFGDRLCRRTVHSIAGVHGVQSAYYRHTTYRSEFGLDLIFSAVHSAQCSAVKDYGQNITLGYMSLTKLVEHHRLKGDLCPDAQPQTVLAMEPCSGRGGPHPTRGVPRPPRRTPWAPKRASQPPPEVTLTLPKLQRLHLHRAPFCYSGKLVTSYEM